MVRSITASQFAADGALVLGGLRAILLQLADPVVAAGVADHSDFARDPMKRLRNTLSFVYAVALGTPEQARVAASRVDRTHTGIPGAADPDRQLWVAATLYDTSFTVYERLFGPIDEALADEVYRRNAAIGTALQVPEHMWPADRAAFAQYWQSKLTTLEVTDAARQVARELFAARAAAWWVRLAMPLVRDLTVGLLPREVRTAYRLRLRPRRYRAALRVARFVVRVTPRFIREWPSRHYLRAGEL